LLLFIAVFSFVIVASFALAPGGGEPFGKRVSGRTAINRAASWTACAPLSRNLLRAAIPLSGQASLPCRHLASRRPLTPEHCLKPGRYFGNEPEYWMRLQNHYLFRKTQREKAAELSAVVPLKVAS